MKSLEEVKQMYKLSEEEHQRIEKEIQRIMLYDRFPVANPKAIIDIAPPASGKTGLNGFGKAQFLDDNVVIINSDELKPFHPKIGEIARLYPQYYTKVTDQESNTWTSALFNEALRQGYNVIFEGTGRNAKILDTIKSKMKNYNVTVRGMAVNELNCLISILERYRYQVMTKGWGRLVTFDHFYETYNAIPDTIDEIEKSRIVDSVEIYKRGSIPSNPSRIYNSKKENRFPNAKYAVLGGREEDIKNSIQCFKKISNELVNILEKQPINDEERIIIQRIIQLGEKSTKKDERQI